VIESGGQKLKSVGSSGASSSSPAD
jgi:hypothetical protein